MLVIQQHYSHKAIQQHYSHKVHPRARPTEAYMAHIQANAEAAVREMLRDFSLHQVC